MPAAGIAVQFPGPNLALNVRAFHPGMLPSVTNGVIVERATYNSRSSPSGFRSSFDGIDYNTTTGAVSVRYLFFGVALLFRLGF